MTNQKLHSKRILPNFNLRAQLIELAEKALAEKALKNESNEDSDNEEERGRKKREDVVENLTSTEVQHPRKTKAKKDENFRLLITEEQLSLFHQQLLQLHKTEKINNLVFVLKTLERFSVSPQQLQKADLFNLLLTLSSHKNGKVVKHSQRLLQQLSD